MGEKVLTFLGRGELWLGGLALAAFLVLTWVLRGAAPGKAVEGESDADSLRAFHRERMVVGVAMGLILILAGGYVAIERGVPWSLPIFAVGFGLVFTLTRVNRQYRHSSPTLRRTIDVSGSFMDLSLLAGILVVANVLAFRYGGRPLDLTREGAYSLTPETVAQVRALDRAVTFTLISGRGPVAELQKVRVRQLLESYRSINPRLIRVRDLNPYEDMAGGEELIKRAPELALLRGGGILIEYGEDKETPPVVVRIQELFELPSPGQLRSGDRFHAPFTGEDAITSALLRLREGKGGKVAFTTGHGELRIDDPGLRGLGDWKSRLARVGCQAIDVNLGEGDVPDDVELLIVAGPADPFKPQEVARIKAYADRGGPVLLLLGNDRPSGLEDFLKAHNLEIGRGMVLDPRASYNGDWKNVLATARSGVEHPISAAMAADRMVLLPRSAPIHVAGLTARPGAAAGDSVDKTLVPSPILQTSRSAWVETDLRNPRPTPDASAGEVPGSVIVGVAVARRKGPVRPGVAPEEQPRLVLFACPLMAENMCQDVTPANLDLLMNSASWLRGRPDTLGISPQTHTALTLNVDQQLGSRLILVPSVTAAMLIIAMGTIVYVARRE
jgi:ABC-type uncharacterized transport system